MYILPWTTPGPFGIILGCGMSLLAIIFAVLILVVDFALYYPFFKVYDKQKCEEEALKVGETKKEEEIETAFVMGDGALYIKAGTEWIAKSVFVLDTFHLEKYINHLKNISKFEKAKYIEKIYSLEEGYISNINAKEIGKLVCNLGAGRVRKEDKIVIC